MQPELALDNSTSLGRNKPTKKEWGHGVTVAPRHMQSEALIPKLSTYRPRTGTPQSPEGPTLRVDYGRKSTPAFINWNLGAQSHLAAVA